jgi:hypothetical protein
MAEIDFAMRDVDEALDFKSTRMCQVGSSYIVGAGMDLDIVVLVGDKAPCIPDLTGNGYTYTSESEYDDDGFHCFRKGDVNVMLTDSVAWFEQFCTAAEVCRLLRLTSKADRVAVHLVIMNDSNAEDAREYAEERYS